jgi:hypothetical protein
MTTTLDLPEELLEGIRRRAAQEKRGLDETVAELLRAGLAASAVQPALIGANAAMLEARRRVVEEFLNDDLGFDLAGFEEGRAADREAAEVRDRTWRR